MKNILLPVLLFASFIPSSFSSPEAVLHPNANCFPLAVYTDVLPYDGSELTIEEVASQERQNDFIRINDLAMGMGTSRSTLDDHTLGESQPGAVEAGTSGDYRAERSEEQATSDGGRPDATRANSGGNGSSRSNPDDNATDSDPDAGDPDIGRLRPMITMSSEPKTYWLRCKLYVPPGNGRAKRFVLDLIRPPTQDGSAEDAGGNTVSETPGGGDGGPTGSRPVETQGAGDGDTPEAEDSGDSGPAGRQDADNGTSSPADEDAKSRVQETFYLKTPDGTIIEKTPDIWVDHNLWKGTLWTMTVQLLLAEGTSTLYVKKSGPDPFYIPYTLYSFKTFFFMSQEKNIPFLILLTVTAALILYNLVLFIVYRNKTIIFFVLALLFFGGYIADKYSLFYFHMSEGYVWLVHRLEYFFIAWALFFFILFLRHSIQSYNTIPKTDIVLRISQYACIVYFIGFIFFIYSVPFMAVWTATEIVIFGICLFAIIQAVRRGIRAARLFIIAWGLYLAISILALLETLQVLPTGSISTPISDMFILIPFIFMSASLGDKLRSLQQEKEELLTENLRKSNFFINISHELRTPLQLINAPVEEITQGVYGKQIQSDHHIFRIIQRNCTRLLNLMSHLLDFSRLEFTEVVPNFEQVDIISLLKVYYHEIKHYADSKGFDFRLSLPEQNTVMVSIDTDLLEKVFFNLLSNAFKSLDKQGTVTVGCSLSQHKRHVSVAVEDNGIGIPPEELPYIFEKYRKVEKTQEHIPEGFGVGLAIVKDSIELLNGKIEVTSKVDHGSTFTITLPVVETLEKEVETEKLSPSVSDTPVSHGDDAVQYFFRIDEIEDIPNRPFNPQKNTLLVLEDNPDLLFYLVDKLKDEYNLLYGYNGRDGLALLEEGKIPDIIISDVLMPRMDGRRFFAKVQEDPLLRGTPFIYLTAVGVETEKRKALESGAISYIVKPFAFNELAATIRSVLKNHALLQQKIRSNLHNELKSIIDTNCRTYELSDREQDVLGLIFQGLQNKEIASHLNISPRTAARHVENIFSKVGVNSRFQLYNIMTNRAD